MKNKKNARAAIRYLNIFVVILIIITAMLVIRGGRSVPPGETAPHTDETESDGNGREDTPTGETEDAGASEEPASAETGTAAPPPETTAPAEKTTAMPEKTTAKQKVNENIDELPVPVQITIDESNFSMTLVNRRFRIPDGYQVQLSPSIPGSDVRLDSRVAPHYTAMYNAAKEAGCYLTPYSGYRSYSVQKTNYENKVRYYRDLGNSESVSKTLAAQVIMPPGSSEHNLGLAMDICGTNYSFDQTKEFKWLQENAADYGFILRYPENKKDITKVVYEPWHWRYVGAENARAIKASGLCLEEYLGETA